MEDEGVACLSLITLYRILREEKLVCTWKLRTKRTWEDWEKATRPNEKWETVPMYLASDQGPNNCGPSWMSIPVIW